MGRTGERGVPFVATFVITVLIGGVVSLVSVGDHDNGEAVPAAATTQHHHGVTAAAEPHGAHVATVPHDAAAPHDATDPHVATDPHDATAPHDATVPHVATDPQATHPHEATVPHEPTMPGEHDGEHPGEHPGDPVCDDESEPSGTVHHPCQPLPPYSTRYAPATPADRAAADRIVADARRFVAPLDGPASYRDAGFGSPLVPLAIRHQHWRHEVNVRDGVTLDPSRPEGLVVYAPRGQAPQVVGIFFAVAAGQQLPPAPAGELMRWHSHDPSCPSFYVSEAEPCTGTIRMMHVFTFDRLTYSGGVFKDDIELRLVDPFAAPMSAAVEQVG